MMIFILLSIREEEAHCELKGALKGSIHLQQKEDGKLTFLGEIRGLMPPGKHGFHVHQVSVLCLCICKYDLICFNGVRVKLLVNFIESSA